MFYAPLQLAGCFVAHMYGGASRMLRSKGLLRESSGSWYAWAFYLYLPPPLRFFATKLTPISLPVF